MFTFLVVRGCLVFVTTSVFAFSFINAFPYFVDDFLVRLTISSNGSCVLSGNVKNPVPCLLARGFPRARTSPLRPSANLVKRLKDTFSPFRFCYSNCNWLLYNPSYSSNFIQGHRGVNYLFCCRHDSISYVLIRYFSLISYITMNIHLKFHFPKLFFISSKKYLNRSRERSCTPNTTENEFRGRSTSGI